MFLSVVALLYNVTKEITYDQSCEQSNQYGEPA